MLSLKLSNYCKAELIFMEDTVIKNTEWEAAWRIVNETGMNLFLTGKAGTGKTTFLRYLKEHTEKRIIVLAPTGIAAINARGVTIHSFFQLPFSPFVPGSHIREQRQQYRFSKEKLKIIRGADLVVIDEVSMVRADLLDAIDDALKRFRRSELPFGGAQMLFIGDLQQLAPVVKDEEWSLLEQYYDSPYFFDSNALKSSAYVTIEFRKVFRQDDRRFIDILNKIRENKIDDNDLAILNSRYIKDFKPLKEDGYIRLTTHNAYAQTVNERELQALPARAYSFEAQTEGVFPELSFPTDRILTLKKGTQVMFVKNDTSVEKRFYNGMIGEVEQINENGFSVRANNSGTLIEVKRVIWQNCKYNIDSETKEIVEEVEGTFCQFPVKTAWAITIHKSQGLTFSHAIIDVHSSFTHGQTYVALSRCKTLEGIVLSAPITRSSLISDNRIDSFTASLSGTVPSDSDISNLRKAYETNLMNSLFDFSSLGSALSNMTRVIDEHLYKAYPLLLEEYKKAVLIFKENITSVAQRFKTQYVGMISCSNTGISGELQERIRKGAAYFIKNVTPLNELFLNTNISSNNKQIEKQITNAKELLAEALRMKLGMLRAAAENEFSVENFLSAKARLLLGAEDVSQTKKKRTASVKDKKLAVPDEILHPKMFEILVAWRREKATEEKLPAYCILAQKAIMGIANLLPADIENLMLIPYVGKRKADKYGNELLRMVADYRKSISATNQDL